MPEINSSRLTKSTSHVIHTGQFFFPEELLQELENMEPYKNDSTKRILNKNDHDFQQDPIQILNVTRQSFDHLSAGITGRIAVVIDQFRADVQPFADHTSLLTAS